MKSEIALSHEFVEFIPKELRERVLYISIPFATAAHLCCCGCGQEVVTPLTPTDWSLIFNGETVSLTPSIGSWGLPCQSHYWIIGDRVEWAKAWSKKRIDAERRRDRQEKSRFFTAGADRVSRIYSRLRRIVVDEEDSGGEPPATD